jgi:hypothetical protein
MKRILLQAAALILPLGAVLYLTQPGAPGEKNYNGMCDASAVAALDGTYFVVADDEQTVLRVYSSLKGGLPVHSLFLAPFLGLPRRGAEVDMEGAARIGDRLYWISSHGRNASGEDQPSRRRFFATSGTVTNGVIDVRPIGRPYENLLQDLIRDPKLAAFDLAGAAKRIPKTPNALNIEGLCATPDGHLLIGFRNPIPQGRALLVPLLNPAEVVDAGKPARFGDPILLDLDGLGIRSIEFRNNRYWIVAGSFDGVNRSSFYQWTGGVEDPLPMDLPEVADLNPEAITFLSSPEGDRLWVVSDDGTRKVNGTDCKRLKNPSAKRFRAVAISLQHSLTASK